MGAAATWASAGRVASPSWAGLPTWGCRTTLCAGMTVDWGAETAGPGTTRHRGAVDAWVITVAARASSPSAAKGNAKQNSSSGKGRATENLLSKDG